MIALLHLYAIMTEKPSSSSENSPEAAQTTENVEDLLLSLRRKQGTWVEWGQACAQLQKAGYNPQAIFEQTGFEPIQQNQIIVASQVYSTLVKAGVSEEVRSHYSSTGSDSLYELRILTQPERAACAEFLLARNLDSLCAREVAKAVKEFSRLHALPQGFSAHPGDAVAYQYWRYARQKTDLPERSRLIVRGLMFAHTQTARQQIEQLLTDLDGVSQLSPPGLPLYRLEAEEELPRIIPVAGKMPLTIVQWQNIPRVRETGLFQLVTTSGNGTWVALPGWQVILNAIEPVVMFINSAHLPSHLGGKPEEVLLVIDKAEPEWDVKSYYVVEEAGQIQLQWFPETPNIPLLGRLILLLRPKRILDEGVTKDLWQIDE